jgi:hypothetical protein
MGFSPDAIVIHYTESDDVSAAVVDVWHEARGFTPRGSNPLKHIGYHALVRKNGVIEAGRSLDVQGTHVLGHNNHTLGICMCGSDRFSWYPTPEQYRSVAALCENWMDEFRIPKTHIFFHKDLNYTSCPGRANKQNILSLIGEEPTGEEEMIPISLDREGGEKDGYVYVISPVKSSNVLMLYGDKGDHDYPVNIYVTPFVGEGVKRSDIAVGGYGNTDNVHGLVMPVGMLHKDMVGEASVIIHSPCKLHGGAM